MWCLLPARQDLLLRNQEAAEEAVPNSICAQGCSGDMLEVPVRAALVEIVAAYVLDTILRFD